MNHGDWQRILVGATLLLAMASGTACTRSKPPRTIVPPTSEPILTGAAPTQVLAQTPEGGATSSPPVATHPASGSPTATGLPPTREPSPTSESRSPTAEPTDTATVPTATAIATPYVTEEVTYKVRRGDTMLGIAARHKTTVRAILKRNNLTNPDTIFVGQTLIIPPSQATPEAQPSQTVQHPVKAGETLSQLARTYTTTADAILRANPSITDPEQLAVGMVLTITIGTASPVRTHTVQPGESLSSIAAEYGVTLRSLIKANETVNLNRIRPGQALIVPE